MRNLCMAIHAMDKYGNSVTRVNYGKFYDYIWEVLRLLWIRIGEFVGID